MFSRRAVASHLLEVSQCVTNTLNDWDGGERDEIEFVAAKDVSKNKFAVYLSDNNC